VSKSYALRTLKERLVRVDLLTLYAFSDKTHAKQRELWRGFLALVMPILLECDASDFERILESAQCKSVEDMLNAVENPKTAVQLVWSMSGTFAEALGFESELGLSAFLDVELPSRVHIFGNTGSKVKEDAIVTHWLRAFRAVQQRPEFLEITVEWKKSFDLLAEVESHEAETDQAS
jgi:hypothetical protein